MSIKDEDELLHGNFEIAIAFLDRLENKQINNNNEKQITTSLILKRILLAYGKVPLFFYLIHFQVLGVLSMILQFLGNGLDLDLVIIPYIFVLMFMFLVFGNFCNSLISLNLDIFFILSLLTA